MRKGIGIIAAAAGFSALMAMSSLAAARITSVNLKAGPDDDAPMTSGECVEPYFYTDTWSYSVLDVEDIDKSSSPSRTHTYEITLEAGDGYYFGDNPSVTYTGITEVTRKKTEDDGDTLILRVESYPYYRYNAPANVRIDEQSEKMEWDSVSQADKYEYVIDWTDKYGDNKSKRGTTTKRYVDISTYLKAYDDHDRYEDCEVKGVAVRAVGNAGENPRTADGDWATYGSVDLGDYDSYDVWSEAVGNAGGTTGSSSGGHTGGVADPGSHWVQDTNGVWHWNTGNGYATGWVNDGTGTYYCDGAGNMLTGWINPDGNWYFMDSSGRMQRGWVFDGVNWYYCNSEGKMQAGWLQDGGNWFYLNPVSGASPYGAMLTSWRDIDGNTYYLNPVSDGTRGAMYVGTRVIDGITYNFNTAHDGTYGRLLR